MFHNMVLNKLLYINCSKYCRTFGPSLLRIDKCHRIPARHFSDSSRSLFKKRSPILLGIVTGLGIGAGYTYYSLQKKPQFRAILNNDMGEKCAVIKDFPDVNISRKVRYSTDTSGLKIVLFQYTTCPFSCKVRSFLDTMGVSYDIVEVNPVFKQDLKWSPYRKVPLVLVKAEDGSYLLLKDSSTIISILSSYLEDSSVSLTEVANCYPEISYQDDDGSLKKEILNRYFLMYHGNIPNGLTKEKIEEVRRWRKWADEVLVHMISPNVYRNSTEALQAFYWFSDAGSWESLFSTWQRYVVIYFGAAAMWVIAKRLKKRYHLKNDVRESLYEACNRWLFHLKQKGGSFHGGSKPDLADISVYGVLLSMEGCTAFADLLQNTKISSWFNKMKDYSRRRITIETA